MRILYPHWLIEFHIENSVVQTVLKPEKKQHFFFVPKISQHPSADLQTHHHPSAGGQQCPLEVLLPGAAVQPGPGLPGGVGAAHRPQHEGRDPAGVHHEDLLPGGDGWSALQTGGNGNYYQTRAEGFGEII